MHNLSNWYRQQTAAGELSFDSYQAQLLKTLDKFLANFSSMNFITRLWRKEYKLGYYIYGEVGRGKSMIMNNMYRFTHTPRKMRIHFHEFMQQIHQELAAVSNAEDPLALIVTNLKQKYDIIYLDEMHVSDIATAMIMKRLLENLFANKVYIVTTSNYPPDGLWPNGLMRERFLPAIAILKERLIVEGLQSPCDYRLRNDSINQLFILQSANADARLGQIFAQINHEASIANVSAQVNDSIEVCGRKIPCRKLGEKIIWFDFTTLCGDMRSQLDYLELVQKFEWFIISDLFCLTLEQKDLARRFTWLIDILYDNSINLALSSSVLIKDIYSRGDFANEFERTISRLEEMQTKEYLEKKLTAKPC